MSPMKNLLLLGLAVLSGCAHRTGEPPRFSVVETGIPQLQQALADGRVTSRQVVLEYLARIGVHQNRLNAAASVNPRALEEAEALDRERAQGRLRGPLHGIPIALKDNIHTRDLPTTGGAVAFEGLQPPYEATLARISRHGIIPITSDQETAGPMARTVTDAAILLGELERSTPDPNDAATRACVAPPNHDYRPFLKRDALRGARIGLPRAFFYDRLSLPGDTNPRGGLNPEQAQLMAEAINTLRLEGAEIVDPADIPSVVSPEPSANFLQWNICVAVKGNDGTCSIVFKYGMKRDFNAWLASLGASAPLDSLAELRRFNSGHSARGATKYGQALLDVSDEIDLVADRARYEADRAKDLRLAGTEGIDAVMKQHRLDAMLFPGFSGANISARPGYPTVAVPFGFVRLNPTVPWPDGFEPPRSPFGVSFAGGACSEPRLVALAYAFEQATRRRVPPP